MTNQNFEAQRLIVQQFVNEHTSHGDIVGAWHRAESGRVTLEPSCSACGAGARVTFDAGLQVEMADGSLRPVEGAPDHAEIFRLVERGDRPCL
jgi:hypothetical protein